MHAEAIVLTDDLTSFERRKLFLLNLGHSMLAEHWLRDGRAPDETVPQAMNDAALRTVLQSAWADYLVELRDRLLNPSSRIGWPTSRRITCKGSRAALRRCLRWPANSGSRLRNRGCARRWRSSSTLHQLEPACQLSRLATPWTGRHPLRRFGASA